MLLDKSSARIRRMFAEIAERYDLLNRLLSLGVDRDWRRRTVELVPPRDSAPILDVCCGTADLTLAYWRAGDGQVEIFGTDFCMPMLIRAKNKIARFVAKQPAAREKAGLRLLAADTLQLPFPDDTFQIVSIAFGLRNLADVNLGLKEMIRVCRPGGSVAILEFSLPRAKLPRMLFRLYLRCFLPRIGQSLARNSQAAYDYLAQSIGRFLQGEEMLAAMQNVGLVNLRCYPFSWGVATLYVGMKLHA